MAIVKISEIQSRIGTVIPSISGSIVAVFPSKSGKGQHGAWKLQNIKIQDSTGDCAVTISGMDQDLNDSHKGKNIEFESVGTKFGLKGVSVEKRDYVNKKGENVSTTGVKVTSTAKIRLEGAGMVQESPDDLDMSPPTEKSADSGFRYPDNTSIDKPRPVTSKSPQERIAQFGKLYRLCVQMADTIIKENDLQEEDKRELSTTFYIQASREGLADKMELF